MQISPSATLGVNSAAAGVSAVTNDEYSIDTVDRKSQNKQNL
jgi:hypothetical protein